MKDLRATGVTRGVSVEVAADPAEVHAFVADVRNLGGLGPETHTCEWVEPGKVFRGHNRVGDFAWSVDCFVVDDRPGERFAFEVSEERYVHWAYDFAPSPRGTRVTHSFEILHLGTAWAKVADEHLPMRWQALEEGMRAALLGIKRRVEAARAPQPA